METAFDTEKILRDLHAQWDELDRKNAESGGVLRACSMTLMATAADRKDAAELRQTLCEVVRDHPLRAIVLRTEADATPDAQVFSQCWSAGGSGQHLCAEGVEIGTDSGNLEDVAGILVALREADLPVVLYCRGSAAFSLRTYDALFPLADKVILDSSKVTGASAALGFLRSLRTRGCRAADLHWTRLTGWREILAHLFDDEALVASDVTSAKVIHGGETASTCALYFASWIRMALPGARVMLEKGEGARGLRSVTLASPQGELSLAKAESRMVEVRGAGRHYRVALPPANEAALLREELSILGPDAVYDQVLG
jgi:glucose-6-phosphate dehydrogenase assembly protein OpcA